MEDARRQGEAPEHRAPGRFWQNTLRVGGRGSLVARWKGTQKMNKTKSLRIRALTDFEGPDPCYGGKNKCMEPTQDTWVGEKT